MRMRYYRKECRKEKRLLAILCRPAKFLNTADAIGFLFEMTRDINVALSNGASKAYIDAVEEIYVPLCELLGFGREEDDVDTAYIEEMIQKRADAKKAKNYAEADAIRNQLREQGIILEDTPQGVKWKKA